MAAGVGRVRGMKRLPKENMVALQARAMDAAGRMERATRALEEARADLDAAHAAIDEARRSK